MSLVTGPTESPADRDPDPTPDPVPEPGSSTDPEAQSRLRRAWAAPLWAHLLALALVLAAAAAVVGTDASFSADEGAAITQARSLADGGGWIVEHPVPEVDPDGDLYPLELSARGSKGVAPFAKHPFYALVLAGAEKVGGSSAMVALSLLGTLVAAAVAAALANHLGGSTLARPALWAVGLGSPLFFDGNIVIAHTLGAAAAGAAVLAALLALDRRRPALAVLVAPLVVVAVLLRTEALLFGLALAAAAARRRPPRPAPPGDGRPGGPGRPGRRRPGRGGRDQVGRRHRGRTADHHARRHRRHSRSDRRADPRLPAHLAATELRRRCGRRRPGGHGGRPRPGRLRRPPPAGGRRAGPPAVHRRRGSGGHRPGGGAGQHRPRAADRLPDPPHRDPGLPPRPSCQLAHAAGGSDVRRVRPGRPRHPVLHRRVGGMGRPVLRHRPARRDPRRPRPPPSGRPEPAPGGRPAREPRPSPSAA